MLCQGQAMTAPHALVPALWQPPLPGGRRGSPSKHWTKCSPPLAQVK